MYKGYTKGIQGYTGIYRVFSGHYKWSYLKYLPARSNGNWQRVHVRPIRRPNNIYGHVWAIVCPALLNQAPSHVKASRYVVYVHMYCSNLLDISLVEKESVVGSHRGRCERCATTVKTPS